MYLMNAGGSRKTLVTHLTDGWLPVEPTDRRAGLTGPLDVRGCASRPGCRGRDIGSTGEPTIQTEKVMAGQEQVRPTRRGGVP